ncbi:hypothetical protein [Bradyrhizobium cosmicum]|uniref:Uncharacterized protein n=1 Tax=Bradyrhizobium cosmicum TaxID=1404864 RepID=A0AAI8MF08_9BRAD|nr:hypothetical protein [Bradyrhizobium cosmicum]BAL77025.1 hypothetical protein S23_38300 [Bradyrhizobium cosmicum]
MTFSDAELAVLAGDLHNIGVFFRLGVVPVPVRIWLGFGAIEPGLNVFDPDGAQYLGFGEIRDVPQVTQLLNGAAERVDFSLSGVDGDILKIASGHDAEAIKSKPMTVGFALMGADWSLIGPVHWLAYYLADYLAGEQQPAVAPASPVRTLTLSCGSRFTGRRRPAYSYWSDVDQQARWPGDLFCSLAPKYAHGFQKTWPVF